MKILFFCLCVLFLSCQKTSRHIASGSLPAETLKVLKLLYPGQSENDIKEKWKNTPDAFQTWRSFPAYYYHLLENHQILKNYKISSRELGLIAGDAHLENFGTLYDPKKNKCYLGLNDFDDVAIAPKVMDLLRLMSGFVLLESADLSNELWRGYQASNSNYSSVGKKLLAQCEKFQNTIEDKYQEVFKTSKCPKGLEKTTEFEISYLKNMISTQEGNYHFSCTRTKDTGGSAYQKRYIVWSKYNKNFIVDEYKPIDVPGYYRTHTNKIDYTELRLTLFKQLGWESLFHEYYYQNLFKKVFWRRPRFESHQSVNWDKLKQDDKKKWAYDLGLILRKIHQKPVGEFKNIFEASQEVAKLFKKEMNR